MIANSSGSTHLINRRKIIVRTLLSLAIAFAFLLPAGAEARPTGDQACVSVKQRASAGFMRCMLQAEAKYTQNQDVRNLFRLRRNCRNRLGNHFERAESRFGSACITRDDAQEVIDDLEDIAKDTTKWLQSNDGDGPVEPRITCGSGTTLNPGSNTCLWNGLTAPDACGNGQIDGAETCDFGNLGGATCESIGEGAGELSCGPGCQFDTSGCFDPEEPGARFEVNANGTVTDHERGLLWESKYDLRGPLQNRDGVHLEMNLGRIFLNTLNRPGQCYAGECGWRIPTAEELESLGNGSTCMAPEELCRRRENLLYWSSSTFGPDAKTVVVGVPDGNTVLGESDDLYRAIAVSDILED